VNTQLSKYIPNIFRLLFLFLFLFTGFACQTTVSDSEPAGIWNRCSLHEGQNDGRANCASVEMPLHWERPDEDRTITVSAKRLPAVSERSAQLWLLHGGPGASGMIQLPPVMEFFQAQLPDFEIYTLDIRGAGYSTYLGCPNEEAADSIGGAELVPEEIDACIAHLEATYGADLYAYSITESAKDLAYFIDKIRQPGIPVFVWGGSGGTYWAHRLLQLGIELDGVIMEGITPPGRNILVEQLDTTEAIGRDILTRCRVDQQCGARMPDPEGLVRNLWVQMDNGHCSALGRTVEDIKQYLRVMMFYRPFNEMLPATLFRLDRCASGDIEFLTALFDRFAASRANEGIAFSRVLNLYIIFSEIWEDPRYPDEAAYRAKFDELFADALFAPPEGEILLRLARELPRYTEPLDDLWASSDIPMLFLQGEMDNSSPLTLAREYELHFNNAWQHFVAFPNTTHLVINGSPTSEAVDPKNCGMKLFVEFLRQPTAELDTSCVNNILPLDFEGAGKVSTVDVPNYWDN
jgi:pimeloyl-ACP methyl ester carboxylesterase